MVSRVKFTQDDAHLFETRSVQEEFEKVIDFGLCVFKALGFKFYGTSFLTDKENTEKYIGVIQIGYWQKMQ